MTQLRTAWRRAVEIAPEDADLADLLALVGPAGNRSCWTCDDIEAPGPAAGDLRSEAAVGSVTGTRLAELATGITHISDGVFEATRPGDDWPWLAVHVIGQNWFSVATRS